MTEWVLIMIISSSSPSMSTVKVSDKESCYRVGTRFVNGNHSHYYPKFICTEVRKDSK
jgi:hypothetical protein